jgi:hypothetical protein
MLRTLDSIFRTEKKKDPQIRERKISMEAEAVVM